MDKKRQMNFNINGNGDNLMNEQPLVSIIIPVYNGENYMREAIDSALAQTYRNVEVLVINDGSRDSGATEKIALSYGDRIRYYHKENGGVATALNLGIEKMKGEYFSWLSHDDMYYPDKVEKEIEALKSQGDMTAVVMSDYDILTENTKTITHVSPCRTYSIEQITNSVFPVLQNLIHGCSLLIHKSQFERVGTFNEKLVTTQDYDLWFRMLRGQRTVYVPKPLVIGRYHDEQGSKTLSCFKPECSDLYIGFLKSITREEIVSMYGSPYNFYYRMSSFFKGAKMEKAYRFAISKFQESEMPENISEQLLPFKKYLSGLSGGKADGICIFCAGAYGIRLFYDLRSKLISVDCFSDNNPEKWGYLFENVYCIPPEKLLDIKDRTLVIVANETPDVVVEQLKSMGFPYVVTKQEIDGELLKMPPVKWITALDSIDGVDYTSKDAQLIIDRFNKTIFDVCKYYEDRAKKFENN